MEKKVKASKAPAIIAVSILICLIGCYFIIPSFNYWVKDAFDILTSGNEEVIEAWIRQYGAWGPVVIILAMVVQMFCFVIPNILLMMIAIISYGPFWGSLLALSGVFASSSFGYFVGRQLSPVTLQALVSSKNQKRISEFIQQYGVAAIMITRLSSFSNDALSFVAGLLSMGYRRYILSTLAGITPLIVILAIYGGNGKIKNALIWIGAISLVLLVVYIRIDTRRKSKSKK
jgi:uncharacterized membrane protein YdjX (TVP38/TMEM64 family)